MRRRVVALICMLFDGVFDRFPRLKVVIGNLGEGIPSSPSTSIGSTPGISTVPSPPLQRRPSEYFGTNLFITTSGMNASPALIYCHTVLGADAIMFAADHPFEPLTHEVAAMDRAPFSPGDLHKIYHENGERIFRL
jgi:predicted TIM-barrel fold metal-dependent hydrolase